MSGAPSPKQEARTEFLRRFFHDLATPLSGVSLHLEIASRRARKGEDPSEALEIARGELQKTMELLEKGRDVLLGVPAEEESFPFDDFVSSVIARDGIAGVRLEGVTEGRARGDPRGLADALSALVSAAVETFPDLPVTVVRERSGPWLRARVESPARPKTAWSGLNLARAKVLAAESGGRVIVEQREDSIQAAFELLEERT